MAKSHTQKSSARRLYFMLFVIFGIIVYYLFRLVLIQVVDGPDLKQQAVDQWTKERITPAERGNIYDRNGKILAVNITSFTVWAEPTRIKDKEEVSIKLSPILDIPAEDIHKRLVDGDAVRKLKQWVSREEAAAIKELQIRGVSIVDGNKRSYPLGNFAPFIVGFTNVDNEGLYGVEGFYDEHLSGIAGIRSIMTDAANRPLPDSAEKVTEPVDGYNLVLTIDETIQKYAEEAAEMAIENNNALSASVIVMDPHTGDILAMANKPDYNPNYPRESLDDNINKEWSNLSMDEQQEKWYAMWRNYAINDIYEPGSTYKIVTAAAALETGSATLNNHYFCTGFVQNVPGARLKCATWWNPHGDQDFNRAFANSCNVAFVDMARQVGRAGMVEYTQKFGFGDLTGIDLKGEQAGIIPRDAENMREVSLATLSYGHGIAVTPIQMINAIAVVANGGDLMVPKVVDKIVDDNGNIIKDFQPEIKNNVISKSTADKMLHMLELAVIDGTGRRAHVPGYRVGGKTGTAQKVINGRYEPGKYISSFGGVAPSDDPKIAVLVIVDEPKGIFYGGTVAGPSAKHVIENTLEYMEVPRIFSDEELENLDTEIIIPDLSGMRIREAGEILAGFGLKYTTQYEIFTEDAIVLDHYPKKNEIVIKGSIVDLYLDSGERDPMHNHNAETEDMLIELP